MEKDWALMKSINKESVYSPKKCILLGFSKGKFLRDLQRQLDSSRTDLFEI